MTKRPGWSGSAIRRTKAREPSANGGACGRELRQGLGGVRVRLLRNIHHWLGVFFAPTILLFAFSGALQTFSLHENKGGGPYKPPAWIVALASIHKDQTLPEPKGGDHADADADAHDHDAPGPAAHDERDAKAPAAKPQADADLDADAAPKPSGPSPLPLKIFVLLLSIGLMVSTVLGVWIALKMRAMRGLTLLLLAAGALVPVVLLFL